MPDLARARCALEGLSIGDAFGSYFFGPAKMVATRLQNRILLTPPWHFTDDTLMALSIFSALRQYGTINQDWLAQSFANRYDRSRGYGQAVRGLLARIRTGESWRQAASTVFGGQGSYGNGGAMRVAPVGAYFADDLHVAIEQVARSAEITHAHPDGVAGEVAVAVASAISWQAASEGQRPIPREFLAQVAAWVPASNVRNGIGQASELVPETSVRQAVSLLGNGEDITAQHTVPFALWCAAQHLDHYEEALWLTASGGGDVDTNCAIVGGIIASGTGIAGIPSLWMQSREPLPDWPFEENS